MLSHLLDELITRIQQEARSLDKNVDASQLKALLESGLAKLDLVPRAEFDAQQAVLARTRQKLDALEKTLAEMENQLKQS